MPLILQYFIKFSLTLAVFYLFYYTVLKNLTFYTWNRFYLLGYSLVAWVIPFISITPWIQPQPVLEEHLLYKVILTGKLDRLPAPAQALFPVSVWTVIMALLAAGSMVMAVRFLLQLIAIRRLKRSATLVSSSRANLYDVNKEISPFSFAQAIFINSRLHNEDDLQKIIGHEFVHVRQRHTIDLLMGELLCIVNWYNPFAWLIKKAIRQNLEFIADQGVLQTGVDARDYQYLLLKVTGLQEFRISNNFTISSLKKRIFMMNKMKSAKVHLAKFLFVLPLLAVVLVVFGQQKKLPARLPSQHGAVADTVPPPPPPPPADAHVGVPPPPPPGAKPPMAPPLPNGVSRITAISNGITVNLKNGQKEMYNLDVPTEKAAYEKKYGKMPPPPPPPAPPVVQQVSIHTMGKIKYTGPEGRVVDTVMPITYFVPNVRIAEHSKDDIQITADSIFVYNNQTGVNQKTRANGSGSWDIWLQGKEGKKESLLSQFDGVLIVDGKTVAPSKLQDIDQSTIESIQIIKGGEGDKITYGEKADNGVIILTTKKNKGLN